jgi:hypothetical protein
MYITVSPRAGYQTKWLTISNTGRIEAFTSIQFRTHLTTKMRCLCPVFSIISRHSVEWCSSISPLQPAVPQTIRAVWSTAARALPLILSVLILLGTRGRPTSQVPSVHISVPFRYYLLQSCYRANVRIDTYRHHSACSCFTFGGSYPPHLRLTPYYFSTLNFTRGRPEKTRMTRPVLVATMNKRRFPSATPNCIQHPLPDVTFADRSRVTFTPFKKKYIFFL